MEAYKWKSLLLEASNTECPMVLPVPDLVKKCPWIPTRGDYRGVYDNDWWDQWVGNWTQSESWMDPVQLFDISRSVNYPGMDRINRLCQGLRDGFKIGAVGASRLPMEADNWTSAYQNGERLADAVQKWLIDKLVVGPLKREQLPADIRVSPISVDIKPTGHGRVCVDLSNPHLPKHLVNLDGDTPVSVNSGIDLSCFPVNMVSTKSILDRCWHAGPDTWLAKQDWRDAYKHFKVSGEDTHLQVISFGGRYFQEQTLTFGCSSSPSLFDQPAEVILKISCIRSGVPRRYCIRQLDDAICLGSEQDVKTWYTFYDDTCRRTGVQLAGNADPAKACAPSQQGQLLGLNMDLVAWSWGIDENKANKMLTLLFKLLDKEWISTGDMSKLSGKLTHYAPVFKGRMERGFLLHSFVPTDPKHKPVRVTLNMKSQASWWVKSITAGKKSNPIPLPWTPTSADPVILYSDAAGPGHGGAGAVAFENFVVVAYLPWPAFINNDVAAHSGHKLGKNMTTLEAIASLLALTMDPDRVRNQSVCVVTDNLAVMHAWRTGHSRDPLCYTVCKSLDTVARALNIRLEIRHRKRCSDPGTTAADLLSRGRVTEILDAVNSRDSKIGWVSRALTSWLGNPTPTRLLGTAIVRELSSITPVLDLEVEWEDELDSVWNKGNTL